MKLPGFSLIELLIVVAIIGTLVVITIPNFKGIRDEQNINNAALELVISLRTAQNNSYSGLKCPNGIESKSWRVSFTSLSVYQLECIYLNQSLIPPALDKFLAKSYTLPNNVEISSIRVDGNCLPQQFYDLVIAFSNISAQVDFTLNDLKATSSGECNARALRQAKNMTININNKSVVVERGGLIRAI